VNSVSPGGIFRNQPDSFVSKYVSKTPLNRMAKEEDVVGTVLFLASSLSSYITGQDLRVDGGYGTS
jgi:NAD(P)-dependent dehydrogenase (short-subunit alcohol dehydrogenase family)